MHSVVSIAKGNINGTQTSYTAQDVLDTKRLLEKCLNNLGGLDVLMGKVESVMIKPNLVEVPYPTTEGSVLTDPRLLEALVMLLKEYGVPKVYVGEGRSVNLKHIASGARDAFYKSGLGQAVERAGGIIVGWDEEPFVPVEIPDGQLFKSVNVPKSILDADYFINVPKLKMHCQTEITVAIKSMQGVYSTEDKVKFHNEAFPWKMVDMLRAVKPDLNIVDGIICGEGYGPIYTSPVDMGCIVASTDPVATDAVCSKMMDVEPVEVPITRVAWAEGMGEMDLDKIEIRGEKIEDVAKHFRRSEIWNPIGYHKHIKIFAGCACRFTLCQIGAAVKRLELDGDFDRLHQDVCIIVGCMAPVPVQDYKNVIICGDDATDHPYYKEGRGTFIPGNPPLPSVQIVETLRQYLD